MNSFLPENYEVPTSDGNYLKLKDGDTKFRILSSAVIGWEAWIAKKPIRKRVDEQFTPDEVDMFDTNDDGSPRKPKHFWAFVVYNYGEKRIQIFEITQKTLMTAIQGFVNDESWGNPMNYDIKINRTGEKLTTEYSVVPTPPAPLAPAIKQLWEEAPKINLDALFTGEDPFAIQ